MAILITLLPAIFEVALLALYEFSTPDSYLYYSKPKVPFDFAAANALLGIPLTAFLVFAGFFLAFNFDKKKIMANIPKTASAVLAAMLLSNATDYLLGSPYGYVDIDEYGIKSVDYTDAINDAIYYGFFFLAILLFLNSGVGTHLLPTVAVIIYVSLVILFIFGILLPSGVVLYATLGTFLIVFSNPKMRRHLAL